VCLLIAMFQVVPDAPLIVAANRDERLDRPAVPMTVLRERGPRVLGGQDLLAGGTWLAVNEQGMVAGLTNQPSADGRDPTKRSRGELPLAFAEYSEAAEAVRAVCGKLDPADYNPCWMLVGDRHSLFSIGIAGGSEPEVEQLGAGLHILENAPLRPASAKATFVRQLIGAAQAWQRDSAAEAADGALEAVLRDHRPSVAEPRTDDAGRIWPGAVTAACVHVPGYGTRSAITVRVPVSGLPLIRVADGPLCEADLRDVTALWAAGTSVQTAK
jgi:uncharacterized protein with NRDE domain